MTDLVFDDILPDDETPIFTPEIPTDAAPAVADAVCKVCGKPLDYAGRGRKPQYCDEHKKRASAGTSTTGGKRNDAIAREAADVLGQINGLIGLGLFLAPAPYKMPETAAALDAASEKFDTAAYDALKASPALARTIARAGGVSGSAGLIVAYGMLAATIAPVAVTEWKANRAG